MTECPACSSRVEFAEVSRLGGCPECGESLEFLFAVAAGRVRL